MLWIKYKLAWMWRTGVMRRSTPSKWEVDYLLGN